MQGKYYRKAITTHHTREKEIYLKYIPDFKNYD